MKADLVAHLKSLNNLYYYPNFGNLGDLLIAEGARQFFKRHGIEYREYDPDNMPQEYCLAHSGGGRFVPVWFGRSNAIMDALTDSRVKECVILPHSFRDVDDCMARFDQRHHLYCREEMSYRYCCMKAPQCHVYLMDDMAFHLKLDELEPLSIPEHPNAEEVATAKCIRKGLFKRMHRWVMESSIEHEWNGRTQRIAFLWRQDGEKFNHFDPSYTYDISGIWHTSGRAMAYNGEILRQFASALKQADVLVSDRLHVCIMAHFCGLEVYLLDNSYGKMSGIYNLSLKQNANVHLIDEQSMPSEMTHAWERLMLRRKGAIRRASLLRWLKKTIKAPERFLRKLRYAVTGKSKHTTDR